MSRMRLDRRLGHEGLPFHGSRVEFPAARIAPLEHATPWCVALEMVGIQLGAFYDAAPSETNDRPIVSRPAATLRLPAVAHVCRSPGKNQILAVPIVHVAARHNEPA